jgi:ribonuclease HII
MLDLKEEKEYFSYGSKIIAGVDEAGRGPLAGPVVAACVLIDENFRIEGSGLEMVKDSKKLSAKKREELFKLIKEKALAVQIGVVDNRVIDKINILQASFLAMRKALALSAIDPDQILVDGSFIIPGIKKKQKAIIKGDSSVWVIAAASIIAKVSRDWLITQADKDYPGYGFVKHKGYGTKEHLESLEKLGPSPIHRLSFEPLKSRFPQKRR